MPVKQEMIFGPCQETSYTAIMLNQESNFARREKNHSLFHMNTLTSALLQERTWMLCKKAASWTGFTQFTPLDEKPPDGHVRYGRRLTKRRATSRPDHLWPELWRGLARNAKLREKHKWAIEKPKLDNARRLRGICFIDSEDKEFKEIMKNARRKLETPMAPAMPCKTCKKGKEREDSWEIHRGQIKTCVYLGIR